MVNLCIPIMQFNSFFKLSYDESMKNIQFGFMLYPKSHKRIVDVTTAAVVTYSQSFC